jgi:hypothetical protein
VSWHQLPLHTRELREHIGKRESDFPFVDTNKQNYSMSSKATAIVQTGLTEQEHQVLQVGPQQSTASYLQRADCCIERIGCRPHCEPQSIAQIHPDILAIVIHKHDISMPQLPEQQEPHPNGVLLFGAVEFVHQARICAKLLQKKVPLNSECDWKQV